MDAMSDSQPPRKYIPLKMRSLDERPRERLLRHGADKLSSAELLGILIRIGTKGRSAVQVAQDVLDSQEDGVAGLASMSPSQLARIKGVGEAKAAGIAAALELAKRTQAAPKKDRIVLESIEDVAYHFRRYYGAGSPEKFVAFYINRRHRLLGELEISRGGSNAVVVDPQRVFKEAVLRDARAIILAHNHPGGSLEPSQHDLDLTKRLEGAGKLFSIPIVEHVIVTADGEAGLLEIGS
jgi:DNA repair protein RadC